MSVASVRTSGRRDNLPVFPIEAGNKGDCGSFSKPLALRYWSRSSRIVDENFGRNSAKELQGILVSGQEVLHRFAQGKLDIAKPAVAEHHDKEGEPSAS